MTRRRGLLALLAAVLPAVLLGGALAPVVAPATAEPAPLAVTLSGPPAVIASGISLDYSWSVSGGTGTPTYQVRAGVRTHGGGTVAWDALQPIDGTTDTRPVAAPPEERCFEVRATDSSTTAIASSCTYLDQDPPSINWTGAWRTITPALARTPVTVRYAGSDDDRVATYDLLARVAPAGRAWGPWFTVAGATTATSVRRGWPAGSNVCFLARVRDRVGHLTQTSAAYDPRCTALPYDDRGLVRSGGAVPVRASWALGGTATLLTGRASLTGPRTPVRSVWVAMRSRGGYCPRLWVAGRQIAAWRCQWYPIAGRAGFRYELPRTLTGRVTLRAGVHDRVRVDAVALAR